MEPPKIEPSVFGVPNDAKIFPGEAGAALGALAIGEQILKLLKTSVGFTADVVEVIVTLALVTDG